MAFKFPMFNSNSFWYHSWLIPLAFFLAMPQMRFTPPGTFERNVRSKMLFATTVILEEKVRASVRALGAPTYPVCVSCFSELGLGRLILDFGEAAAMLTPKSLLVYAVDSSYRFYFDDPEKFEVYLSQDLATWKLVGLGNGITQFDLGPEFTGFRFIQLRNEPLSGKKYGPKIDAVQLNY